MLHVDKKKEDRFTLGLNSVHYICAAEQNQMFKGIYIYEKRGKKLQKSKQCIKNKEINNNKEASRKEKKE